MNHAPAFQFYASDYLADAQVQMLTLEQEGAYIRLLAYCWRERSIPANPDDLVKLCKGCATDVVTTVARLFQPKPNDPDRLIHKRLDEEREKQTRYREQQAAAGRSSAAKRAAQKTVQAPLEPPLQPPLEQTLNGTSTLQSSSSSSSTSKLADEENSGIEPSIESSMTVSDGASGERGNEFSDIVHEIYRHYPVKVHHARAMQAINSALRVVDGKTLLDAVKRFAAETKRTNTTKPMWPEEWFSKQMWKSFLPSEEGCPSAEREEDDQNLSPFSSDLYEKLRST